MADDRPEFDLYETDFYAWTQAQAAALRARGAGSNALEYDRLAEEIEDVGGSQKNAVRSALRNIIVHLLEIDASHAERPRRHWRVEILNFRLNIEDVITRTIANEMEAELPALHAKARKLAQARLDEHERDTKVDCARSWTLSQLLGEADDPLTAFFPDLDDPS